MANLSATELELAADIVKDELKKRREDTKRQWLERVWHEIDRQIQMRPDTTFKLSQDGKWDSSKAWMPEMEEPLQSQSLEVLVDDALRVWFPDSGPWMEAHAQVSTELFTAIDEANVITGEEDPLTDTTQDDVDKLCRGNVEHYLRQYDFRSHIKDVATETFKYSVGVGRMRKVTKRINLDESTGTTGIDSEFPCFVPRSIKKTYLDTRKYDILAAGEQLGPSIIYCDCRKLEDLKMAAKNGDDTWISGAFEDVEGDEDGNIITAEWEGDLLIEFNDDTEPTLYKNIIVSVVMDGEIQRVYRVEDNPFESSSYILFVYQKEQIEGAYGSSPLMKGRTSQAASTETWNRALQVAALTAERPITYDPSDPNIQADGGVRYEPGAQIGTIGSIQLLDVGDVGAMLAMYQGMNEKYYDVVGVNPPRLGERTVSHTTATSKQLELMRGSVRTVSFAQDMLKSQFVQILEMTYNMGRKLQGSKEISFYCDDFNAFVTLESNKLLPENVVWKAFGSGGPDEEALQNARRREAVVDAVQMDQLRMQSLAVAQQTGVQPLLNYDQLIRERLIEGDVQNIDSAINTPRARVPLELVERPDAAPNSGEVAPATGAAIQSLGQRVS